MLSREVMGLFALGVLWLNTLLVVAAALQQGRALLARWARLRNGGVVGLGAWRGRVVRGDGSGGTFAMHTIEQVGRRVDRVNADEIEFHDRSFDSLVVGGVIVCAGTTEEGLDVIAGESAEFWPRPDRQVASAACASSAAFDAAYELARTARGYRREFSTSIVEGDEVWIVGERFAPRDSGSRSSVRAPAGDVLWVSAFDPAPWLARRLLLVVGFVVMCLMGSTGVTVLALHQPRFGPVSTVGAALGLVFFLALLLPGGVKLRAAVRATDSALFRGRWTRPSAKRDRQVAEQSA